MKYWVIIDKEQRGPFTLEEMRSLHLDPQTPVWHKGMADWAPLVTRPELADLIAATPDVSAGLIAVPQGEVPPGYVVVAQSPGAKKPSSYIILSIVLIFFGVLVLSLVSLFFGWRVRKALRTGDFVKACRNSDRAAMVNIINIVVSLIMLPFGIVLEMTGFSLF